MNHPGLRLEGDPFLGSGWYLGCPSPGRNVVGRPERSTALATFDVGAKYNNGCSGRSLTLVMLTAPVAITKMPISKPRPIVMEDREGVIDRMVFREVTLDNWRDFERLFECRGGPKACWCMVWRATPVEAKQTDSLSRKAAIGGRIAADTVVGLLGYLDNEPVAWCSVAPRATYRRLVDDGGNDEGVWSIACFFVVRRLRGRGVSRRMIGAAVEFARSHGASAVEAYPVDPSSPSYRFMGFVQTFEAAGFREVGHVGSRRHVFQLRFADQ